MKAVNASNEQVLLLTVSDVDRRLKEALYTNDVGCPETVLYELSQATYHATFMERISRAVWRCLKSNTAHSRRIQKALTLLTYLALNGAEACLDDIINHIDDVTDLHNKVFPTNVRELEYIIKDKAINLVNLVCDREMLERKRKETAALRSRFVGVSSNNGKVATQELYKPIYAVDAKPGLMGVAPIAASKVWNFLSKPASERGKPNKVLQMFKMMGKDRRTNGDQVKPFPMLRTKGTGTTVQHHRHPAGRLHWPTEENKPRLEFDSFRTEDDTVASSSSDDYRSTSDTESDSSVDSSERSRSASRGRRRSMVDSVSSSSRESDVDDGSDSDSDDVFTHGGRGEGRRTGFERERAPRPAQAREVAVRDERSSAYRERQEVAVYDTATTRHTDARPNSGRQRMAERQIDINEEVNRLSIGAGPSQPRRGVWSRPTYTGDGGANARLGGNLENTDHEVRGLRAGLGDFAPELWPDREVEDVQLTPNPLAQPGDVLEVLAVHARLALLEEHNRLGPEALQRLGLALVAGVGGGLGFAGAVGPRGKGVRPGEPLGGPPQSHGGVFVEPAVDVDVLLAAFVHPECGVNAPQTDDVAEAHVELVGAAIHEKEQGVIGVGVVGFPVDRRVDDLVVHHVVPELLASRHHPDHLDRHHVHVNGLEVPGDGRERSVNFGRRDGCGGCGPRCGVFHRGLRFQGRGCSNFTTVLGVTAGGLFLGRRWPFDMLRDGAEDDWVGLR
ncbi:ENTH domain-containing protein [Babesia caballi]|uniref:ENTH domain-containing protein n=1 Tax=Babesia caballi TaxID=5871 RepID=A0AAV4LWE3_BABCB|nr:ENTH domain-containing protein [Babesia caballi]